jgi:hypothetical protein
MTKACIAARRRYRQKKTKKGAGCRCPKKGGAIGWVPRKWGGQKGKKKKWTKQKYGLKKGAGVRRRRRRNTAQGAGWLEDVGSFLTNAAQTVLPLLPMIL